LGTSSLMASSLTCSGLAPTLARMPATSLPSSRSRAHASLAMPPVALGIEQNPSGVSERISGRTVHGCAGGLDLDQPSRSLESDAGLRRSDRRPVYYHHQQHSPSGLNFFRRGNMRDFRSVITSATVLRPRFAPQSGALFISISSISRICTTSAATKRCAYSSSAIDLSLTISIKSR